MDFFYKPAFRKFVKKQNKAFQLVIEDEIERIGKDSTTGEEKRETCQDSGFINLNSEASNI